jgi:hypothetical protein
MRTCNGSNIKPIGTKELVDSQDTEEERKFFRERGFWLTMVCHQQSRATSSEHHSERYSQKAGYFRRSLLLIGTFILSSAFTSSYAHSADQSSIGRRQVIEKVDASNVFLRKGSNSRTVVPKRTSKSKLHTADPTRNQREKAVKGAKSRNWISKSMQSIYSMRPTPVTEGALFLS